MNMQHTLEQTQHEGTLLRWAFFSELGVIQRVGYV